MSLFPWHDTNPHPTAASVSFKCDAIAPNLINTMAEEPHLMRENMRVAINLTIATTVGVHSKIASLDLVLGIPTGLLVIQHIDSARFIHRSVTSVGVNFPGNQLDIVSAFGLVSVRTCPIKKMHSWETCGQHAPESRRRSLIRRRK